MDDLKEKVVVKAKEFRLNSFNTEKNNPKFIQLLGMSKGEVEGIDVSSIIKDSAKDLQLSQVILLELFELIDELIVRDGGSLPE